LGWAPSTAANIPRAVLHPVKYGDRCQHSSSGHRAACISSFLLLLIIFIIFFVKFPVCTSSTGIAWGRLFGQPVFIIELKYNVVNTNDHDCSFPASTRTARRRFRTAAIATGIKINDTNYNYDHGNHNNSSWTLPTGSGPTRRRFRTAAIATGIIINDTNYNNHHDNHNNSSWTLPTGSGPTRRRVWPTTIAKGVNDTNDDCCCVFSRGPGSWSAGRRFWRRRISGCIGIRLVLDGRAGSDHHGLCNWVWTTTTWRAYHNFITIFLLFYELNKSPVNLTVNA
jgi:hypothetical protein